MMIDDTSTLDSGGFCWQSGTQSDSDIDDLLSSAVQSPDGPPMAPSEMGQSDSPDPEQREVGDSGADPKPLPADDDATAADVPEKPRRKWNGKPRKAKWWPAYEDAREYHDKGYCVIPCSGKRPALRSWGQYCEQRPTSDELKRWFRGEKNQSRNIGIIIGQVSGNVICADFDKPGSYDKWSQNYPDYARRLPTHKTRRGYHVFFKASIDLLWELLGEQKTCVAQSYGELLIDSHNCLVPPSIHPDDPHCVYEWIIDLPAVSDVLWIDPREVGLFDPSFKDEKAQREARIEQREPREQTRYSDVAVKDINIPDSPAQTIIPHVPQVATIEYLKVELTSALENQIRLAIDKHIPKKHGTRHRCIFTLAREWKSITELTRADPSILYSYFREWFDRAEPYIRTKDWWDNWHEFRDSWKRIRFLQSEETVMICAERARRSDHIPAEVADNPDPGIISLAMFFRELQRAHGPGREFPLANRTVAAFLHCSLGTANHRIHELIERGIIEVADYGNRMEGIAWRYRYLGSL